MTARQKRIRKDILGKVREYCRAKDGEKFIAGRTVINYAGRVYDEKEVANLVDASLDFWLTAGRYAGLFEKKFASLLGSKYCALTNSGSSANLLSVSALMSPLLGKRRLVRGDEVITVASGFPTTVNPIIQNGLVPVFVDVELGTYNIMVDRIEPALSRKTKAILIAHTLGNPADIEAIIKIVKKRGLWFIEDNSDALGAEYKGKLTGTFGDISTHSFYAAHQITMGEGGATVTGNALLQRIIASFRDWGRDCWCQTGHDNTCGKRFGWKLGSLPLGYDHKYIYSHIGYNLKITDLQAAIGCAQLEKLPKFIEARRKNFERLYNHLSAYEEYFILPQAERYSNPSWFGFPLLVRNEAPFTRNEIVKYLEKKRIATRMLFGGNLTRQPAYKGTRYRIDRPLKNTDLVLNGLFWIGVYPGIDKPRLEYILERFDNFFKKIRR